LRPVRPRSMASTTSTPRVNATQARALLIGDLL
jgi:hypothetical protein